MSADEMSVDEEALYKSPEWMNVDRYELGAMAGLDPTWIRPAWYLNKCITTITKYEVPINPALTCSNIFIDSTWSAVIILVLEKRSTKSWLKIGKIVSY